MKKTVSAKKLAVSAAIVGAGLLPLKSLAQSIDKDFQDFKNKTEKEFKAFKDSINADFKRYMADNEKELGQESQEERNKNMAQELKKPWKNQKLRQNSLKMKKPKKQPAVPQKTR